MARGGKGRAVPFEQAPGYRSSDRIRIMTVWRRIQHLEDRIANHVGEKPPFFDIQEASALRWVLEEAKMPVPPKKDL